MALLIDRTGRHPIPAGATRITDLREAPDLLRGIRRYDTTTPAISTATTQNERPYPLARR